MSGPSTPAPANDVLDRAGDLAIQIVNDMREAAPQVTEAAVRYVWAQGVTGLVIAGVFTVVALIFLYAGLRCIEACHRAGTQAEAAEKADTRGYGESRKKARDLRESEGGWVGVALCCGVVTLGCLVIAVGNVASSLPTVLAPEGATVMKLIAAARGG